MDTAHCSLAECHSGMWSQEEVPFAEENTYITVSGVVKDKQNRRTLEYVNVSVPGSSVGTVTNADGEFSLKIEDAEMVFALEISHIGYHNNRVRLDKEHLSDLKIYLTPHANMLNEIVVYAHNPRFIVEEAIRKIPVNYSNKNNMLTGFYRETVQKGRRYINISEAIIDVYKTSYEDMTTTRDRVQVLKGRRLLSQRASDTLGVKLAGGPTLSIYVDIVKNQDALLDVETLNYYDFFMEEPVQIDNRQQYVISFRPRVVLPYALYYANCILIVTSCRLLVRNLACLWIIKSRRYRLFLPRNLMAYVLNHRNFLSLLPIKMWMGKPF